MSYTISDARFNGKKIAIIKNTNLSNEEIKELEEFVAQNKKGAIWFSVHKTILIHHLDYINSKNYNFHHFDKSTQEYLYYLWNVEKVPDKVPDYATSIGGVAMLILSLDSARVFLVFEYGKYKCVTGAVDCDELSLETGLREIKEEVSIDLDKSFEPRVCGLWNIKSARPGNINDTLICYAVRASNDYFDLDQDEIKEGKWFDVAFLNSAYRNMIQDNYLKTVKDPTSEYYVYQETKLSICALIWLQNVLYDKCFDNHLYGKYNLIF